MSTFMRRLISELGVFFNSSRLLDARNTQREKRKRPIVYGYVIIKTTESSTITEALKWKPGWRCYL
jgi:hypothetical protein